MMGVRYAKYQWYTTLAVRRLVEYLISVALRKKVQVLFTTHSNEALKPLPDKAIWVCANDEIFHGEIKY